MILKTGWETISLEVIKNWEGIKRRMADFTICKFITREVEFDEKHL